jgi:hypothetical protein
MLMFLIMIFFVFAILGYYSPYIWPLPPGRYYSPLTSKEIHVLKDNTNRSTEDNIDDLYLELGKLEVELLLEKDL